MFTDPWLLLSLLVFGVVITLGTDWLVARLGRSSTAPALFLWSSATVGRVVAGLLWILLLLAAGLIASRYIERIRSAAAGYVAFGLLAGGLSLVRAWLYQRSRPGMFEESPVAKAASPTATSAGLRRVTYLLFALVLYLALSLMARKAVVPVFLFPLGLGALLPDLDSQRALLSRILPSLPRTVESGQGHAGALHSLAGAGSAALVTLPLILPFGVAGWLLVPLGFLSHLALDVLQPEGLLLLWPWRSTRYHAWRSTIGAGASGNDTERWLIPVLAVTAILLLFVVGVRPAAPSPAPSYEQARQQYTDIRGRNLALADVQGTWQATGRRVQGRFEILNSAGDSFVMHDRYTGRVFMAGRTAADQLYLNRIDVLPGAGVRVKATELHVDRQLLGESLSVLYDMQREPGLEHIFASGDVVLAEAQETRGRSLRADYSQTTLRKIEALGAGHYRLQYLTASDLIALATVGVESADLVVVATYTVPTSGPTVTPLPTLPEMTQPAGEVEGSVP